MTTTTATTTTILPKNKTGLFATDTLQELRSKAQSINNVPALSPQNRVAGSGNDLLALTEKNYHKLQQNRSSKTETQQYYPADKSNGTTVDTANDSRSTTNGIRNGFPPSIIRRQKLRSNNVMANRENNTSRLDTKTGTKQRSITPAPGSARLKSEIEEINSRLKIYRDLKPVLYPSVQDTSSTPQSALSYSTAYALSTQSINNTANTLASNSRVYDGSVSKQKDNSASMTIHSQSINGDKTHSSSFALQMPQQSNIGSDSIFLSHTPVLAANKTRAKQNTYRTYANKSVSCPFYVMYFTNLAMQRHHTLGNVEDYKIPNVSYSARRSPIRRPHSPISTNTYSTNDELDSMTDKTSYYSSKRFSAKIAAFENENSYLLKDAIRTTSWNHLQV